MAIDVVMPQMGESIFEGTITKWLKKAGDKVERDEPLFEISTDKVDAEIPAPSAGVLKEIKVAEGQTVPVQTVVAVIDSNGAGAATAAAAPAPAKAEAPKPAKAEESKPEPAKAAPAPAPQAARPAPPTAAKASPAGDGHKVRSSPLVRRLAKDHDIDLTQVPGTGAGGRVAKRDILGAIEGGTARAGAPTSGAAASSGSTAAAARPSAPPPPPASGATQAHAGFESAVPREKMYFGHYEVQPMSVMRQRIAEHMVLSKRVSPHVYSIDEADVTGIAALRAKMKSKFEESTAPS